MKLPSSFNYDPFHFLNQIETLNTPGEKKPSPLPSIPPNFHGPIPLAGLACNVIWLWLPELKSSVNKLLNIYNYAPGKVLITCNLCTTRKAETNYRGVKLCLSLIVIVEDAINIVNLNMVDMEKELLMAVKRCHLLHDNHPSDRSNSAKGLM